MGCPSGSAGHTCSGYSVRAEGNTTDSRWGGKMGKPQDFWSVMNLVHYMCDSHSKN